MFKDYMSRFTLFKGLGKKVEKGKINHIAIAPNFSKIDDVMKCKAKMLEVIRFQIEKQIPIVTINLSGAEENTELLNGLFSKLQDDELIAGNKVKVFILGKWYDLSGDVVNTIKQAIEETKDYDSYFLNFCLNYDGHEEIIDACRMIARKVKMDKLQIEDITDEEIKDNLYSSYFIPPDVMLVYGPDNRLGGFLLWDSQNTKIKLMKKNFSDFNGKDMD